MKKIFAFSKYIFYGVGGAEKSMVEILKNKSTQGFEIELLGVENPKNFNSSKYEISSAQNWKKTPVILNYQFKRFFYLEYFLNKNRLLGFFKALNTDADLYAYGIYAAVAAIGYQGPTTIYLRSESDLGINDNYYTGFKKWLKFIYVILEYPFYLKYIKDLRVSYAKSKLVFNSQWMANECKKRFGIEGRVEYPTVDIVSLKKNYKLNNQVVEKGIVFVGDAEVKGLSTVKAIAKILIKENFFIFDRHVVEKKVENNITYMPWSTDNSLPFKYAKLLIVPSLWNEAFGRVSIEAQALSIPVLVSNRGGLPETVEFNDKYIVKKYLDPKEWVRQIEEVGV